MTQFDSALSGLDASALEELMEAYYAGHNVGELIKKFQLTCRPNQLVGLFPREILSGKCDWCGGKLARKRVSKTRSRWEKAERIRCTNCSHVIDDHCRCQNCEVNRRTIEDQKKVIALARVMRFCSERWSYEPRPVLCDELDPHVAIALLTLVRSGGWHENRTTIFPFTHSAYAVAPTKNMKEELINLLLAERLIAPCPEVTPTEAFSFNGVVSEYDIGKTHWRLLLHDPMSFVDELERHVGVPEYRECWGAELHQEWKRLGIEECVQCVEYNLSIRGLPMTGSHALRALFNQLLRHFSVAQCFRLIYMCAKDAVDFKARNVGVWPQHAANYLIGACQRRADKSRSENWVIFPAPAGVWQKSVFAQVLHDVFLRHGEVGFFELGNWE